MEWQQLEYFVTVARYQHFTRSAESLSISQPALSRSIANLEKELGVPLFERNGRNVQLNHFGQLFLIRAEAAIKEVERGKQEIMDLSDPMTGEVSLAFLHMLGINFVPSLLSSFRESYPSMKFNLAQDTNNQLLTESLKKGDYDFCITIPDNLTEDLHWHPLTSAELFIAVSKKHELANHQHIRLSDIQQFNYVALKKRCGLSLTIARIFEEANFKPNVVMEADELDTLIGLVAADFGISLIPVNNGINTDQLVFLKVLEPICEQSIGLVWKKDRYLSPTAKKFLDVARSVQVVYT